MSTIPVSVGKKRAWWKFWSKESEAETLPLFKKDSTRSDGDKISEGDESGAVQEDNGEIKSSYKSRALFIGFVSFILWLVQGINMSTDYKMNTNGLVPRDASLLHMIFVAPLLHTSVVHLMENWVAFALTGFYLSSKGIRNSIVIGIIFWLSGEGLLWCIGLNEQHFGFNVITFACIGYIVGEMVFDLSLTAFVVFLTTFGAELIIWSSWGFSQEMTWDSVLIGLIDGLFVCLVVSFFD
eukprot:c13507_g1_i1.p1 GENE.c13507_g1_i1~~c13507_g1_i1.p1  ORF type:complete len:239 (-),score=99.62 c13507_g1_i1:8-724(-)